MPDGRAVEQFTLENANGVRMSVLSLGGIVRSLVVPDRLGKTVDIALGFDTVADYFDDGMFIGALIGRYAGRIARGRFTLDGADHQLPLNDGANHLHGGPIGFHRVPWQVEPFESGGAPALHLHRTSPAGEAGYPGTLRTDVTYTLTDANELAIDYRAVTDCATPVNLTFHGYFNLSGHCAGDVLDHELTLGASRFLPADAALIPTGEIRDVRGTPLDFTTPIATGARLDAGDDRFGLRHGYDHAYVLDAPRPTGELAFAARIRDPRSGRSLELFTTEPGIQLYLGGGLNDVGKGGCEYRAFAGLALETQHFPNSPNEPSFPPTILRPGATFTSRTVYRFRA